MHIQEATAYQHHLIFYLLPIVVLHCSNAHKFMLYNRIDFNCDLQTDLDLHEFIKLDQYMAYYSHYGVMVSDVL